MAIRQSCRCCNSRLRGEDCLNVSIDPSIRRLLAGQLDTFEKLEVAVALFRALGQTLSVDELVRASGLPHGQIVEGIHGLVGVQLANHAAGLVRLVVRAADRDAFVALVDLHARDRAAIAQAMSVDAMDKIRGMAARTFAFQSGRRRDDDDT